MEFQDVVRKRRMHRRFTAEPVPAEAVDRMVRNAVRAPSAGFSQGWAFVVLDRPEDTDRFWRAASPASGRDMSSWLAGMTTAPVLILALASKAAYLRRYAERDKGWTDQDEGRWPVPFWHVDVGMASLLILQTAVDEGLGACFFGVSPDEVPAVRTELGIPDEFEITGVVAVGHPADGGAAGSPARRTRRPLDEVVHRGGWTSRG
ncbi:nitroreductase family protein [Antribacter gilvus]|uniref:nitroreductase family protein n=1 Tax=Antribacter gilvus TaxID=2304675 RepID=UPI000F76D98D|nr:nitroreductase family protein [Antribacter gilvus]